jgi:signal peptidase II
MMTTPRRTILILFVIFACIGCDQASKSLAQRELPGSPPVTLLGRTIHFQYTENTGALLGVGSSLSPIVRFWLLIVFAGAALTAILAFTIVDKKLRKSDIFALSIVLGGGLGNLTDRLLKGGIVVDFMRLSIGPFETAIFNLADVMITFGLAFLLLSNVPWFNRPPQNPDNG